MLLLDGLDKRTVEVWTEHLWHPLVDRYELYLQFKRLLQLLVCLLELSQAHSQRGDFQDTLGG